MIVTWTCGCTTHGWQEEGVSVQWVEQFNMDGRPEIVAFGTYCTPCSIKGISDGWLMKNDPSDHNNHDFFSGDTE